MQTTTIIQPRKKLGLADLAELWRYRELLFFFSWRDLKVRYKQTAIGVAWAVFQPLATMLIFTLFFGTLLKVPSDGIPYPIFVYTGLLFWQFFSSSLGDVSGSLVSNQSIITKVYFPRLILPLAVVATNFIDFCVASGVLVALMVYYGFLPNLMGLFILPVLLLMTYFAALGGGLFLSALNVKYRDVRYILPYFMQMLLFITPVIYPASIAGKYSWLLAINPMTGIIKAARGALLGTEPVNWALLGISSLAILVLFAVGLVVFKKTERYFADIV
ncbi:MAG TPA: ABC transporter permease [Candidatus Paceibacterota bacterium]|nr:ABC transporter permease [Candidatus Paceibacterota bacterium]